MENQEAFNSKEYVDDMIADGKTPHIRLIGRFFKEKGMFFPTKQTVVSEIKRWVRDAQFVASYPEDDISRVFFYVKEEFPEYWNLSTMRKYIPQARNLRK